MLTTEFLTGLNMFVFNTPYKSHRRRTRMNCHGFCMELCIFHCFFCFHVTISHKQLLHLYCNMHSIYSRQHAYLHHLISMGSQNFSETELKTMGWTAWLKSGRTWRFFIAPKKTHRVVGQIRSLGEIDSQVERTIHGIRSILLGYILMFYILLGYIYILMF